MANQPRLARVRKGYSNSRCPPGLLSSLLRTSAGSLVCRTPIRLHPTQPFGCSVYRCRQTSGPCQRLFLPHAILFCLCAAATCKGGEDYHPDGILTSDAARACSHDSADARISRVQRRRRRFTLPRAKLPELSRVGVILMPLELLGSEPIGAFPTA